ncbi:MAG: MFS transporter [Acidimicrobiales bacterium]|nr:MFS transporter [Acidimicrobiales bacterium]HJM96970.1 MFS transporter [Acidimicrobiales bacterium]
MSENVRTDPHARPFWRPTGAAAAAITVVALPGFLIGAFAPEIKDDLSFGDTELGALLTFGYLVSSIVMSVAGGVADKRGPQLILRFGVIIAAIAALLTGVVSNTYFLLLLCIGLNRVAEGVIQPATNTLISTGVAPDRQGIAMALKQSAVPFSTAMAGFAVPTLGIIFGWRGAFLVVAFLAIPTWFAIPKVTVLNTKKFPSRREMWGSRHLQIIAIAGAFSAAAVVTVSGFLTTSAKNAGYSESSAGLILGLGGIVMIASRLGWGYLADRFQFDRFKAVAMSLLLGSISFILFSVGSKETILLGALLVFGIGWSWPGLLLLGVIEQHPEEPGAATATLQTSIRLGAMFAPIGFGLIADSFGYGTAWICSFGVTLLGSVLMLFASKATQKR